MARPVCAWMMWGLLLAAGEQPGVAAESETANAETIAARAKEVFRVRCHECHGGAAVNADVDVLDRDLLVEKRKVVVPGKPDDSRLMQVVLVQDDNMMPPEGQPRPNAEQITLLASDQQFPAGQLLRGEGVTDRVVRPFFDAARMVKRTLLIETR